MMGVVVTHLPYLAVVHDGPVVIHLPKGVYFQRSLLVKVIQLVTEDVLCEDLHVSVSVWPAPPPQHTRTLS